MSNRAVNQDPVVENRRAQLRAWIDQHFGGSQAAFAASTANAEQGERQINQGELSALLRNKSFGEKRARSLERQSGMPSGYLDAQTSAGYKPSARMAKEPTTPGDVAFGPPVRWPFSLVSYQRLTDLREKLGTRQANEAISEMDKHLDVMVARWERELAQPKKRAAGR